MARFDKVIDKLHKQHVPSTNVTPDYWKQGNYHSHLRNGFGLIYTEKLYMHQEDIYDHTNSNVI